MEGVIRYRLRWRQLVPQTLPAVAVSYPAWSAIGWLRGLGLLAFLGVVLWSARTAAGVDLGPDALVLLGMRRRVVPWSRIGAVTVRRTFGQQCVQVTADGRTWTLRAPTHTPVLAPDPGFEAKLATIQRTWEERRGAQWRPPMWQAPMVQAAT